MSLRAKASHEYQNTSEADWNPGKYNVVSRTLLESPEVWFARLWNRFQETGNVRRRPGAGRSRATTSTDDRYIQLTAPSKQNRECYAAAKTVALGNRTKGVQPNST
ncbi:hypothetical protein TNCV_4832701 [Trichonephila clavipes]|nr:hypothetical protein TNCV_4832701 [Trichonephila clavipes]